MRLKVGDRAAFKTFTGEVITGKVIADMGRCFLVVGDCGRTDGRYHDGLFRFTQHDMIDERNHLSN